jgi:hypothetical protein
MKIIGKTENGFVLIASADEVANLIGYHSKYSDAKAVRDLDVGSEIRVAEMYRHLSRLGHAKQEISDMAAKLRAAADLITALPDPIVGAQAEADNKEQK